MIRNPVPKMTSIILSILLMAGCGSDPGFDRNTVFINPNGAVQFVNMIGDSPELTVLHGLNTTQVAFGFASTLTTRVVDDYDWRVAYRDANNSEVTIARAENTSLAEEDLSTFLLMGTTGQADVQVVNYRITPIADRVDTKTEVWFAANSAKFPMFDLYITEADADLATSLPVATVTSGAFTELFTIDAGANKRLRITEAAGSTVLFDSRVLNLPGASREMFAIVDNFGTNGENYVGVVRANSTTGGRLSNWAQPTSLRFANFTTRGPIDFQLGPLTESALAHAVIPAYQSVSSDDATLVIKDQENNVLLSSEISPGTGEFQSLLLFDSTDPVVAAIVTADDRRSVVARSNIQFVNGSQEVVDIFFLRAGNTTTNTTPAINDLTFTASGNGETRPGDVTITVTGASDTTTRSTLSTTLEEGKNYTFVFDNELHLVN